jgi:hypothetical protein
VRIHGPDARDMCTDIENDDSSASGVYYLISSDTDNRRWWIGSVSCPYFSIRTIMNFTEQKLFLGKLMVAQLGKTQKTEKTYFVL